MEETPLLISVLVFIATVLFISGVASYAGRRRENLELLRRMRQVDEGMPGESDTSFFHTLKNRLLSLVESLGVRVKPKAEGDLSHLRRTFLKAGYRGENAAVIFFGVKTLLAVLLGLGGLVAKVTIVNPLLPLQFLILSVLLALIGFYLPDLWLRLRMNRRKEEILKGFPDALDLLVVCVEAGIGLDAAINRVGEEIKLSHPVLSEELKVLNLELRAGKMRRDALRNLALRTDLEDVSSFVTLLIQTDKFGTSVAQALRVHSDYMRTRRRQRAEEIAAKLPIKLVFPLVMFIFPSLMVVLLGPAVIRVFKALLPALSH